MLDAGCWMLDAGCWMLDAGYWILDAGCWMLDTGCWMLDAGYSMPADRGLRLAARSSRLEAGTLCPGSRRRPSPPQAVAKAARRLGLPIGEQNLSAPTSPPDPAHTVSSGQRSAVGKGRQHPASSIQYKVFGGGLGEALLLKKGAPREGGRRGNRGRRRGRRRGRLKGRAGHLPFAPGDVIW